MGLFGYVIVLFACKTALACEIPSLWKGKRFTEEGENDSNITFSGSHVWWPVYYERRLLNMWDCFFYDDTYLVLKSSMAFTKDNVTYHAYRCLMHVTTNSSLLFHYSLQDLSGNPHISLVPVNESSVAPCVLCNTTNHGIHVHILYDKVVLNCGCGIYCHELYDTCTNSTVTSTNCSQTAVLVSPTSEEILSTSNTSSNASGVTTSTGVYNLSDSSQYSVNIPQSRLKIIITKYGAYLAYALLILLGSVSFIVLFYRCIHLIIRNCCRKRSNKVQPI